MNTPSSITLTTAAQLRQHDTTLAASGRPGRIKATAARSRPRPSPSSRPMPAPNIKSRSPMPWQSCATSSRPLAMLAHLSTACRVLRHCRGNAPPDRRRGRCPANRRRRKRLAEIPRAIKHRTPSSRMPTSDTSPPACATTRRGAPDPARATVRTPAKALQAEESALQAELDALKRFNTTHNSDDLPRASEIPAPVESELPPCLLIRPALPAAARAS
jgi:hypothetical protein